MPKIEWKDIPAQDEPSRYVRRSMERKAVNAMVSLADALNYGRMDTADLSIAIGTELHLVERRMRALQCAAKLVGGLSIHDLRAMLDEAY